MRYRLIVTDIDGTLLNERGEVTERVRATLAELERRGSMVVLATARPPRRIRRLYRELRLTGPVITYNGLRSAPFTLYSWRQQTARVGHQCDARDGFLSRHPRTPPADGVTCGAGQTTGR